MSIYHLEYFGGPEDGQVCMSPRPYEETVSLDGSIYRAKGTGDEVLEWVSDTERRICLYYAGKGPPVPQPPACDVCGT